MRHRTRSLKVTLILASAILSAGCGDSLNPFEPELTSATDNFQLQATGVTDVTLTRTYSWANTGTRASINHSTTTSQGNTQLTIRDAAGTVVYSKALSPSLNEPTTAGVAGAWSIELRLTNYSGTLNFRVQKL